MSQASIAMYSGRCGLLGQCDLYGRGATLRSARKFGRGGAKGYWRAHRAAAWGSLDKSQFGDRIYMSLACIGGIAMARRQKMKCWANLRT